MKKRIKLLTILSSIIMSGPFANLLWQNNNSTSLNSNNKVNNISNKKLTTFEEFNGNLIGATKGTFTIQYTDVDHCEITNVSKSFTVYGNFNFNGGKFVFNDITYTITKIGENAFYNCSRNTVFTDKEIRAILFEEGVEYIGKNAFYYCCDIADKIIKLPNSLKSIWYDSFSKTKVEKLDLIKLDHIININYSYKDKEKALSADDLEKIYVKSEKVKEEYSKVESWRLSSKKIEVREKAPIKKITIHANSIGGDFGTVTLDVSDPNNSIIKECSSDFSASGNFNFNGGKFTYDGNSYTISEIASDTFNCVDIHQYFHNCILTIPSTIKKIGDRAFEECVGSGEDKGLVGIKFEEGLEEIGKSAFAGCADLWRYSWRIKLPNSLKIIKKDCFCVTKIEVIDLTALDHIIETDYDVLYKEKNEDEIVVVYELTIVIETTIVYVM